MSKGPVLIIGGTSDMGMAIARKYASKGYDLLLTARDTSLVERQKTDLVIRFDIKVEALALDILDLASHSEFVEQLNPLAETVVCVVGLLGDQKNDEQDANAAVTVFRTNFEGPAHLLGLIANKMEQRGSGTIIGISSVAGDRGRASNYIYGSAKAGFTAFLSGLRNRLAGKDIHVLTVKPGFVRTKMIDGIETPKALTSTADHVAEKVFQAAQSKKNILYVSWHWRWVMTIIKAIPESIFKKLSI